MSSQHSYLARTNRDGDRTPPPFAPATPPGRTLPGMKTRLDQDDSLARRIANHALELQGLALATMVMIGSTGSLAGCQNPL